MSVHLIYRTPYNLLDGKFYRKFEFDSVLAFFQSFWQFVDENPEEFNKKIAEYIGIEIYGLWGLVRDYSKEEADYSTKFNSPKDFQELLNYLEDAYHEEIEYFGENAIQVFTDDDELQLAYYIFDDDYMQNHPIETAYLLHSNWELPINFSIESSFKEKIAIKNRLKNTNGEGKIYFCFFRNCDGGNLEDLENNILSIEGLRMNELLTYLEDTESLDDLFYSVLVLRACLIHKDWETILAKLTKFYPSIDWDTNSNIYDKLMLSIQDAYNYILESYQKSLAKSYCHLPNPTNLSKYKISPHLIQISLHTQTWDIHPVTDAKNPNLFDYWLIFDDLWASANPVLANSILNYASRWNALIE